MTLDLKAKAKQIVSQWDDGIEDFSGEIQDVYKALKEVQDATRREIIELCAEIVHINNVNREKTDEFELLALLTTSEKKEG